MDWPKLYSPHTELWNSYLNTIHPYFTLCAGKKVLEIGPFKGHHTDVIESYAPSSITLVEPLPLDITNLHNSHPNCEIVQEDIFFYLEKARDFEVVVCCGVLYHLHSPIYLLELIANRISPKYLYIETFPGTEEILVVEEKDNTPGHRILINNWKSAKMALNTPKNILINALHNLGYKMILKNTTMIKPPGISPFFGVFEKI